MNGFISHQDRTSMGGNEGIAASPTPGRSMPSVAETGLELLRAMMDGKVPKPETMTLLGLVFVSVEHGTVTMRMGSGDDHRNAMGPVDGCAVAALFEAALGSAIQSVLPGGRTFTTLDMAVRYETPVAIETGYLTATARTIDVGEHGVMAEAQLVDAQGRLFATASTKSMVVEMREIVQPAPNGRTWELADWFRIS